MKIVVLIGGGRTGIDFLQSLLDGHPEISQSYKINTQLC